MSVHDDYASAAMTVLIGRLEVDPTRNLGRADERAAKVMAEHAQCIAQVMVRASCEWHGHDVEPIVDLALGETWHRCVRCGQFDFDDDVSEGLETLTSVKMKTQRGER